LQIAEDPNIRETLEDIQIREVRTRMVAADKRFKQSGSPADKAEFDKLRTEVYYKELALYKARCERFPNKLEFRYELAIRHKLLGEYSEAIRELQVARNDPATRADAYWPWGVLSEHQAVSSGHGAIRSGHPGDPRRDAENKKKALYRAGKLALQTGNTPTAERYLTTLAAMDYAYRDVSALLDKIAKRRNDGGSVGERPAEA